MLYVIRHGRTEWLEQKRNQGWSHNPINEKGEVQAWRAGVQLRNQGTGFTAIYSSTLLRCKQTAETVNKVLGLPIYFDDRIVEYSSGTVQGKWKDTLGPIYDDYKANPEKYNAETHQDVYKRVKSFIDDLRANKVDNAIIVTHQGTINMLRYAITHDKWDIATFKDTRYQYWNGEIYQFELY